MMRTFSKFFGFILCNHRVKSPRKVRWLDEPSVSRIQTGLSDLFKPCITALWLAAVHGGVKQNPCQSRLGRKRNNDVNWEKPSVVLLRDSFTVKMLSSSDKRATTALPVLIPRCSFMVIQTSLEQVLLALIPPLRLSEKKADWLWNPLKFRTNFLQEVGKMDELEFRFELWKRSSCQARLQVRRVCKVKTKKNRHFSLLCNLQFPLPSLAFLNFHNVYLSCLLLSHYKLHRELK